MAVTEGVAQAKDYAERLHIQYTYFIKGDGIYQIDMETGAEKYVSHYPSSEELWTLTFTKQDEWRDYFSTISFEDRGGLSTGPKTKQGKKRSVQNGFKIRLEKTIVRNRTSYMNIFL